MKALLTAALLMASVGAFAAEPPNGVQPQPAEPPPTRSDPDLYAAIMQLNIMVGRLYALQGEQTDLLRRIEENTAWMKGKK